MLEAIKWDMYSELEKKALLQRANSTCAPSISRQVRSIIDEVRQDKDVALRKFTQRYDDVGVVDFAVSAKEFDAAQNSVSEDVLQAMQQVCEQLRRFHDLQRPKNLRVETAPGIVCEQRWEPISKVGLYIPGGSAPLVSSVLMLGIPSQIAGCTNTILCTPPNKSGQIDPALIVAATLCGIKNIYKVGGAQAIAAMAYGTQSIPKVDKIFGPGNSWVTQAKLLVAEDPVGASYDLAAGPSELMVIADNSADASFVAADLLAQMEHGPDSQALLICTDSNKQNEVKQCIQSQYQKLLRTKCISAALENSRMIFVSCIEEAIAIANDYAPEHLSLQVSDARRYLPLIKNAGSIFLGPWSPEAAGDYASGTNHVLPTGGYARAMSGLGVMNFMKSMSVQELTRTGLASISNTIRTLTAIEGLDAHWASVNYRFNEV